MIWNSIAICTGNPRCLEINNAKTIINLQLFSLTADVCGNYCITLLMMKTRSVKEEFEGNNLSLYTAKTITKIFLHIFFNNLKNKKLPTLLRNLINILRNQL